MDGGTIRAGVLSIEAYDDRALETEIKIESKSHL